jgi:hypothetical protein
LDLALSNVSGLGSLTYMAHKNTVTNLKYLLNLSPCLNPFKQRPIGHAEHILLSGRQKQIFWRDRRVNKTGVTQRLLLNKYTTNLIDSLI